MRFIFKILIGMIIFNALLFIFTTEFGGSGGQDITGTETNEPGDLGYDITSSGFAYSVITVNGALFAGVGIVSWLTKNPAWVGAGVLCGVIFSLYMTGTAHIANLFQSYGGDFAIHIWNIFTFSFAVIAVISIVEVFTGRSVDD